MDILTILQKFNIDYSPEERLSFPVSGEDKVLIITAGHINLFLQKDSHSPLYPITTIATGHLAHGFINPDAHKEWHLIAKASINASIITLTPTDFFAAMVHHEYR